MTTILPTLIVFLIITLVVAAYIWYLKRNGYIGHLNNANIEKEMIRQKAEQSRAEQFCEWYIRHYYFRE